MGSSCWKAFEQYGYCNGDIKGNGGSSGDNSNNQGDCPMDVDFLEALIHDLVEEYSVPEEKVIIAGFSNGGSMAYRYFCEKSDTIGGTVVVGQTYADPFVGFWDSSLNSGDDFAVNGLAAMERWRSELSTSVLGCNATDV